MVLRDTDLEWLSAYAAGELPVEIAADLERRMDTDPVYKEAALAFLRAEQALSNYRNQKWYAAFRDWDSRPPADQTLDANRPFRLSTLWKIAAVLVPIMIIAGWLWWYKGGTDYQAAADRAFQAYDNDSGLSTLSDGEMSGFEYFDQQDYAKAISAFLLQLKSHPDDGLTEYYLGIAYLGNGQPLQAIPLLEKHLEDPAVNRDNCRWYLALCYLCEGEISTTTAHLEQLIHQDKPPGPQARQLLDWINAKE